MKIFNKVKNKIITSNNRDKLILSGAFAIIIMLFVGVVFRLVGLDNFMIDKNINGEYDGNYTHSFNSFLIWIQTSFVLTFSLNEYNKSVIPKIIFLFPLIYFINYCPLPQMPFLMPVFFILLIKFDYRTLDRLIFISLLSVILQLISGFVKYGLFSFNPIKNNQNIIITAIYMIDLYINYIFILLLDKKGVLKCGGHSFFGVLMKKVFLRKRKEKYADSSKNL